MQPASLQKKTSTASNTNSHGNQQKGGISLPAVPVYQQKPIQKMELEEEQPMQGKFATQLKAESTAALPTSIAQLEGLEEEMPMQGKFIIQREELEEEMPIQPKFTFQKKANSTGLPDNLKAGVENLSGHSMDDVKVHYNSSQPAELQAHAYAQGTDIHIAPGQEKHLPHEAWHVAQQKQGRVKATMQMKQGVAVNDDAGLETEADIMGTKSLADTTAQLLQDKTHQLSTGLKVVQKVNDHFFPDVGEPHIHVHKGGVTFTGIGHNHKTLLSGDKKFENVIAATRLELGQGSAREKRINQWIKRHAKTW